MPSLLTEFGCKDVMLDGVHQTGRKERCYMKVPSSDREEGEMLHEGALLRQGGRRDAT